MVGTTCTICLEDVKSPVSIPCGHIHCEGCLVQYVEQQDEVAQAPCPTCRAPFCIATPDLRFVPQKYHKYILPTVRRVYLSQPTAQTNPENVTYLKSMISALENRTETLDETNTFLRSRVANLEKRVAGLTQDKERLMDRCEAGLASTKKLGEKERDARHEKEKLEKELESLKRKYDAMKGKYKALKHAKSPAPPLVQSFTSTKRTSAQAALDIDPKSEEAKSPGARIILPIPKRPRMAFGGWCATVPEAQSEPEDDKRSVKMEEDEDEGELEYERAAVKAEDDEDIKPFTSISTYGSVLASAPNSFPRVKKEPVNSPYAHAFSSRSTHSSPIRRPALSPYKASDNESDDEEAAALFSTLPRLPSLDLTGQSSKAQTRKVQKLKPSGLSRVFQSMDVDDSGHSPSTSASSPQLPTPGPSSRPFSGYSHLPTPSFMKPARSGLSAGDVFSPRRLKMSDTAGGHGSIDYSSSPLRMALQEDEEDEKSMFRRSYVFRGKKINPTAE